MELWNTLTKILSSRPLLKTTFSQKAFQRLELGKKGENIACKFLKKKGFYIWKRNWRTRQGELDIIAYCDRKLRIIEVKTRQKSHQADYPAIDAITPDKLARLEKLSANFVKRNAKQLRIRGLTSFTVEAITVLINKNWLKSAEIIYYQNLSEDFNYRNLNGNWSVGFYENTK